MRSFGATSVQLKRGKNRASSRKRRQGNGLEFLPSWFVARRSIQLSYGRTRTLFTINSLPQFLLQFQPQVSMHSHPINSKCLSKTVLAFERLALRPDALSRLQQLNSSTSAAIFGSSVQLRVFASDWWPDENDLFIAVYDPAAKRSARQRSGTDGLRSFSTNSAFSRYV